MTSYTFLLDKMYGATHRLLVSKRVTLTLTCFRLKSLEALGHLDIIVSNLPIDP